MTTKHETTHPTTGDGYHHIRQTVMVDLHADPNGSGWVICEHTNERAQLPSILIDGPTVEECDCADSPACEDAADALASTELPSSLELLYLLAHSLGYRVTARTDY